MNTNNYAELAEKARRIRINALKAIHAAKSGHPGGSLSSADILATLYFGELNIDPKNPKMTDRDKFVLSKGHGVPALYSDRWGANSRDTLICVRFLGLRCQPVRSDRDFPQQ